MRYFRFVVCAAILLFVSGAASAQQDYINNFAGGGPNNVPATSADVNYPITTATDSAGNFYIASYNQQRVFKVSPGGTLTVLAGNGFTGYSGDGGPATQAELSLYLQSQIAVDSSGNVYIPDYYNCVVRVVNHTTGNISTFAGTPGSCTFAGDTGPATSASVYYPQGLAVDSTGNVYISDFGYYRIRQVNTSGIINTVAGNGTFCAGYSNNPCGDGGPATSAALGQIYSLAVDSAGNVFTSDEYYYNEVVRLFKVGGNINTVAGTYYGAGPGTSPCGQSVSVTCGDGGPATSAGFASYANMGIASDAKGNLFIADFYNSDVREVICADSAVTCTAPAGKTKGDIYTVAGTGGSYGDTGDTGPATSATMGYAYGVAVDSSDDIFVPDYNHLVVREVTNSTGKINTVAGNGTLNFSGNNIPATDAVLNSPWGVASDSTGNVYIADRYNCIVRKVNTAGIITVFAGTPGTCSSGGDGGPATSAFLSYPEGVAVDPSGNVYIADTNNYLVRVVNTSGTISIFAGNASSFTGPGPATSSGVYNVSSVAADAAGNVYITDPQDSLILKVNGGNLTVFAGVPDTYGFAGDGGPATSATLYEPAGVTVDNAGNVYFSDYYNNRVRKVNTAGLISTYAGNGSCGWEGDGGLAVETSICNPENVAVDPAADLIISDSANQRIRLVDGAGNIHTVAGNGTPGFSGPEENVLATTAELYNPYGVGVDPSGNIYIGDYSNNLVRIVTALAELNGSPSSVVFDTQQTGTTSPAATVTLTSSGPLTISGSITASANFSELDDCPSSLPSGTSCTVDVYFSPTSAGIINGTLTIADNALFNNPLVISLRGTATDLTISPNPLNFGNETDGTPVTDTVTVTGSTTYAATSATLTGDTTDYSINPANNTCHGTVSLCSIGITFNPSTSGLHKATLWIHDSDPTSAQSVAITGSGCVSCSVLETFTPNTITFPVQTIKSTSKATTVKFTNNGASSLTINKPTATAGFKLSLTGVAAPTCSLTATTVVTAAGFCNFGVEFSPTVTGTTNGTVKVTFPADANGNTFITMNVSGTGTNVKLSKNPLAFGTVASGTKDETLTVTNEGTGPLNISGATITGTGSGQFAILGTSTCPTIGPIAHLGTCTYVVQFTHMADANSFSVDLNISSNDPESPTVDVMTAKD